MDTFLSFITLVKNYLARVNLSLLVQTTEPCLGNKIIAFTHLVLLCLHARWHIKNVYSITASPRNHKTSVVIPSIPTALPHLDQGIVFYQLLSKQTPASIPILNRTGTYGNSSVIPIPNMGVLKNKHQIDQWNRYNRLIDKI